MIDAHAAIHALFAKYGLDWHRTPEASVEAGALWGVVPGMHCTRWGTFTPTTGIPVAVTVLAQKGKRLHDPIATVEMVQTPTGAWLMTTCYRCHYAGEGAAPSVWSPVGYDTREEAIHAGACALYTKLLPLCTETCAPAASRTTARALCAEIEPYRVGQLTLF